MRSLNGLGMSKYNAAKKKPKEDTATLDEEKGLE